jgi:hypothetical protein
MRTQLPSALLATALACTYFAGPAQAQSPRTFVSAAGNDSNPCSFAAPCRHFQAAVNATSAGGEVDALDPAGYGPITISHAITIEGQSWSYIAPPASGNAITINAGASDKIVIHGVSLNGAGITGGTNGIVLNSAGSLTVTNCTLQNFVYDGSSQTTGNGILVQPTSGAVNFAITNTLVSNNGDAAILFFPPNGGSPTVNAVIDHVVAIGNSFGIDITGGTQNSTTDVAISNSIASNNFNEGIFAGFGLALTISIDNTTLKGNGNGITARPPASVLLTRSVIQGNGTGTNNLTSNTFYTYGNNLIDLNGNHFAGTALNSSVTLR